MDQSVENETTKNNYKNIIEEIQKKSPATKIYIQSMLPINNELNGSKVSSETIVELNTYLKNLSSDYDNCEFIDLYPHFQVNGQMNTDYTNDGTHLNGQGYLLWKEQIQDFVNG
ncbi:GDSL-like Lipase/Acylhydrolase family protein [Trichococcus collinsii]|uniref:GDSL-like Lipase/Acylhydrolase family protein n=1 Tax=Trichococcus collinsii TaxID=157076 RepID=A0AB38A433_9LACT|nr:GDSL-like Lipase/Acylhydrolase family protein [Trichococcus collinsii]